MDNPTLFLSYHNEDTAYADNIEQYYEGSNIIIRRYTHDVPYGEDFREFMKSIRNGYAVLIISGKYLKSFNCMYEILQLRQDEDYQNRTVRVVTDPTVYDPFTPITYAQYWQERSQKFDSEANKLEAKNTGKGISERAKLFNDIASQIGDFLDEVLNIHNPDTTGAQMAIDDFLKKKGHDIIREEKVPSSTLKSILNAIDKTGAQIINTVVDSGTASGDDGHITFTLNNSEKISLTNITLDGGTAYDNNVDVVLDGGTI